MQHRHDQQQSVVRHSWYYSFISNLNPNGSDPWLRTFLYSLANGNKNLQVTVFQLIARYTTRRVPLLT